MEQKNVLEILLQTQVPQMKEKQVMMRRLSEACGAKVVFTLRQLGYTQLQEIRRIGNGNTFDLHVILCGVVSPNLRDKKLMEKHGASSPVELVKQLLTAGEISELSEEIGKLSGYGELQLEEIDNH